MSTEPHMKKIDTHVDRSLYDAYDQWVSDRVGKLSTRDMIRAMFRIFNAAPEPIKQLSLTGHPTHLEAAMFLEIEQIANRIVAAAANDAPLTPQNQDDSAQADKSKRKSGSSS